MSEDPRPFTIYRDRRGKPRWFQPIVEAWWVLTGRHSLHSAWQAGLDHGSYMEYERLIVNKAAIVELKQREQRISVEASLANRIQNQFGQWRG